MRKRLPQCPRGLLFQVMVGGVSLLALTPGGAQAAIYTRCEQVATARDCLPGSGGSATLPDAFSIRADGTATLDTVFNWKVKNCRSRLGQLRGQMALILDNSKSAETTDPAASRSDALNLFMQKFVERSFTSGVATNNATYPKIGLINYNGRAGIKNTNAPVDEYNAGFTPSFCSSPIPAYPDATAISRWNETSDEGVKISICEYLPLRATEAQSSVFILQQFASFAARIPRGSTDFTYFYKGAKSVFQDANPANVGRHVVLITDGLPNIPKNVAASTCRATPRLKNEAIVSGTLLGQQREYCVDRQAPLAISEAHTEALKSDYSGINFHHMLYTEGQRAYFDYDTDGQPRLNPADFLIENSARTGNGKVKFSYAKDESTLSSQLESFFDKMDVNALQYVTVRVLPAGGGAALDYNAVSPNEPGSEFSIKFIGLKPGENTVTVTAVWQDGTTSARTLKVTVDSSTLSGVQCTPQSDDKTVDGDPKGARNPTGDGFYNAPTSPGVFRDYRNADPNNTLAENEFALVGDNQNKLPISKLRLQGGTGNCGSLAHAQLKTADTPRGNLTLAFLLSLPVCVGALLRRRARREG